MLEKNVYLLWLQGWENAGWLQKQVAESWIKHNAGWYIHFIDENNLKTYVNDIDYIYTKNISPQAKSDIIRLSLLKNHGGIWADASLLCMQPLEHWIHEAVETSELWMYHGHGANMEFGPASWFIASKKNGYLISKWKEACDLYWEKNETQDNYFFLDSLFKNLYENDELFKVLWLLVPFLYCELDGQSHTLSKHGIENNTPRIKQLITDKPPYVLKMDKSWNTIFTDLNSDECQNSNGFHAIVMSKRYHINSVIYKHEMKHPPGHYLYAYNFLSTLNNEKLDVMIYLNVYFNNYIYDNIIFLYCPFKVGSTTLVSSIRLFNIDKVNVVHLHDNEYFTFIMKRDVSFVSVLDMVYFNRSLGKNVYLMDIYRLPIERKISEFFERAARYHFNTSEKELATYDISRVTNRLNCIFPYISNDDYYKEWFGLTSFPPSFNHETKYLLQIVNGIKYVKIRLNDVKEWPRIIKEIFGLDIVVVYDYESEQKEDIGEYYKKFKKEYKMPLNYCNEILKSDTF